MTHSEIDLSAVENFPVQQALENWVKSPELDMSLHFNVVRNLVNYFLFVDITGSKNVGEENQELVISGREVGDLGVFLAAFTSEGHLLMDREKNHSEDDDQPASLLQQSFDVLQYAANDPYSGLIVNPGSNEEREFWISKEEIEAYYPLSLAELSVGLKTTIEQSFLSGDPTEALEAFSRFEEIWVSLGTEEEPASTTVELDGKHFFPVFTSLPELLYFYGSQYIGSLVPISELTANLVGHAEGYIVNPAGPSLMVTFQQNNPSSSS